MNDFIDIDYHLCSTLDRLDWQRTLQYILHVIYDDVLTVRDDQNTPLLRRSPFIALFGWTGLSVASAISR